MAKILMATTEAVPFAKTGGLADVCGRLPIELTKLGHEVAVIMPAFRSVLRGEYDLELTGVEFEIPLGSHVIEGELLRGRLPGSDVPIYFVRNDDYFDRPHLYGEGGTDYRDNCQRFIYFARAVLESLRHLEFDVELIHCNDWQTGLIPVYLNAEYRSARGYEEMATMMTIHNMAYQGRFWHWDMLLTGLDWKYFNSRELEFYGDLNFLKAGIVFADAITTVSPRYSEEIQGPELGCGLEGVLRNRRSVLRGILNGVDYGVWNPRTDTFLPANYGPDNWRSGKAQCKAALQAHTGLKVDPQTPLLGFVGRLAEQKGATFIAEIMRKWASHDDTQWVILGTGDPEVERRLTEAAQLMPGRAVVQIDFNERLAHQIEAASDMFLMPSRYEPCGLNQMYSLKYGAVPIVHATGGLADTITNADADSLANQTANGFSFSHYDVNALEHAMLRACEMYRTNRECWKQVVETGMNQDWSWQRSASLYAQFYAETISRVKEKHRAEDSVGP